MRLTKKEQETGITNGKDLVKNIQEREGITRRHAQQILRDLVADITKSLADGKSVYIPKLGKFYVKEPKEKNIRNPVTGELQKMTLAKRVHFHQSDGLGRIFTGQQDEENT